MCGFCGIFHFREAAIDENVLRTMMASIRHRGPDGEGRYISKGIGLGHRRLSIIDLEGGGQPIGNEDGSIQIVFNGEIYNYIEIRNELLGYGHTFRTKSDTEVVVHAYEQWGLECVDHFIGIFAFAIWNEKERVLFLARDHLGVKPLYYARIGDTLVFASEIKSILQFPGFNPGIDFKSLADLFTYRYVPSPKTLFRSVYKVPPGHLMVIRGTVQEIRRYWKWRPSPDLVRNKIDETALIEEYRNLIFDSVRLQMRSDVPVGLFLSSGIDSGTLLALMCSVTSEPIYTFTIGFEDGQKTNETEDARLLALKFGADHSQMIVTASDYERYYNDYLWNLEEPVGNETAAAFYFVSRIASEKVKVVLTGQGADEPWAGYDRYVGAKVSEIYSRLPASLTDAVARVVSHLPHSERMKRAAWSLGEHDVLRRLSKIYSFYDESMKERLFLRNVKEEMTKDGYLPEMALASLQSDVSEMDIVTQMLYIDTRASLPDDLLMVNDKMSMANSIEARVPFLDHRIIQFVETLPAKLKLRRSTGKYLHKKAVERWLPIEMVYRKKKGFDNPIGQWLRERMAPLVREYLLSSESRIASLCDVAYIKQMVRLHEEKRENYRRHIYLLLSLELWLRRFQGAGI
jgi:asparagine synthase (glutamine-hydrolysing)